MTRIIIQFAAAILTLTALSVAAVAQTNPQLRTDITVEDRFVTLGDLFENAGAYANRAVFQSPAPGRSGTIRADRVAEAARDIGMFWQNNGQVGVVRIARASIILSIEEMTRVIEISLRDRLNLSPSATIGITLQRNLAPIHLPINFVGDVIVTRLEFRAANGQFRVEIATRDETSTLPIIAIRGQAIETILIPVLSRDVRRGDVITDSDIEMNEIPRQRISGDILRTINAMTGKAARRTLMAGRTVSANDIEEPKLVHRNSLVTITFTTPGMTLTAQGRALDDAAMGETVRLINIRSNRIVEGVVMSNGTVAMAPNNASRILTAGNAGSTRVAAATNQ
ncbi:MAG: flagellar basal body P-ring formation protein FlgA [Rhizobiales bacterium]|nr:flagellar basal body P-ring formation protein FlgA [Hyphomicrobiales bacterium]